MTEPIEMAEKKEKIDKFSRRPKTSNFKQQSLPAWEPVVRPVPIIIICYFLGIIFIVIGVICYTAASGTYEQTIQYDSLCGTTNLCDISFTIATNLSQQVFFYYQIDGMYQNHRRYTKSRDDHQLRGEHVTISELSDCYPVIAVNGSGDINFAYFPCGLVAKSMFNDTFTLYQIESNGTKLIDWSKSGIAWKSDVDNLFKTPPADQEGFDVEMNSELFTDEDFIVWMRTGAFPTFRKLYRYTDHLDAGTYNLSINNSYDVISFNGKKAFVISTTTLIGGLNDFLGYSYAVVGCIMIICGFLFCCVQLIAPRNLGDPKYLKWDY